MSTVSAAVTVITVLAFAGAVFCWRMSCVLRRSLHPDQTADFGPFDDYARGTDDNLLADCWHIWNTPDSEPDQAGFDRLRDAIRDHRTEDGA
jgi:hypothetical protein